VSLLKPKLIGDVWITSWLHKILSERKGCFTSTLDIGLSWEEVCVEEGRLYTKRLSSPVLIDEVKPSRDDRVVVIDKQLGVLEAIISSDKGFYKLKATGMDKAPTIEINGIHMHRIVDIDPWTDSLYKVFDARVKEGDIVLDTCMGLGYTSIISLIRGAQRVFTYEVDENVIEIAGMNPWSRMLMDERIVINHADVVDEIRDLPANYFDKIIHDPPRLTKDYGDLYSIDFYVQLNRVLKPGGVLYHYTGQPGIHGRANIVGNIGSRLKKAGFRVLKFSEKSLGFIAVKEP
jgi:predicted methyltransferase